MTHKERETLIEMYRALEQLPGRIRSDTGRASLERADRAAGAEQARVLVYTWLREANMLPHGGR